MKSQYVQRKIGHNQVRTMARPAEFDRDQVIDKALLTFREKGYSGTSVRDLELATGLNPGSIYMAFGSKKQFYLETVAKYYTTLQDQLTRQLAGNEVPLFGLRGYFYQVVDAAVSHSPERCCYLVKSALELSYCEPEIQKLIIDHFAVIHGLFSKAVRDAQKVGYVPIHKDPEIMGSILLNTLFGLNVKSMLAPDKTTLLTIVDQMFDLVTA